MLWKLSRNNYLRKQTKKLCDFLEPNEAVYCTKVRFASFLSGRFTTMTVINPPKSKLAKCTSVHWFVWKPYFCFIVSICILAFVFCVRLWNSNFTCFYFINTKDIFFACLCHRSCWMLFLTHMWQRGPQPLPQPRRQQPYQCQA